MKHLTLLFTLFISLLFQIDAKAQNTAPALLMAQHELTDSNVYLSWWEPGTPVTLHYDNGTLATSIGTNDEAAFDVAMRYDPDQLTSFDGMSMTNFSFIPVESSATYVIKVWMGENADSTVYSDTVSGLTFQDWNTVAFTEPLLLDASQTYYFGYHVNTPTGYPAGCDNGPSVKGKSDLIRFDSVFVSLYDINMDLDFSFNIRVELETTTDSKKLVNAINDEVNYMGSAIDLSSQVAKEEKTFVHKSKGPSPDSYIIYRDDVEIATATEGNYNDVLPISGIYTYEVSAVYGTEESDRSDEIKVAYDNSRVSVNCVVSMGFINTATYISENGDTILSSPGSPGVFKGLIELDFENEFVAPIAWHSATAILGQDPFANAQTEELFMHYFLTTFSFPAAYFNGDIFLGGGSGESLYEVYQPLYDSALNVKTPIAFESSIEETGNGKFNLNVKANKVGVLVNDNLQLITVLTQESIDYEWGDFEEVRFVATEVYPSTYGTPLSFDGEDLAEYNIEINVDPFEPIEKYRLVTYIQDTNSLHIYNGDYLKFPIEKRIVFKVQSNEMAIEGASVNVIDRVLTTDADGYASVMIYDNLGEVSYDVSKEGYGLVSDVFDVAEVDTVMVELVSLTGVKQYIPTKSSIYPNPANSVVNITSNKAVEVNIFDISGKLLTSIPNAAIQHEISISALEVGVYYIQLFDGTNSETVKLFKE